MMKRFFILLIVNITVFIIVRYISLLSAFLFGLGASDHYKYESYAYIPGTLIQLGILIILAFKNNDEHLKHRYQFYFIIAILVFLSLAGFLKILPYSIIPY